MRNRRTVVPARIRSMPRMLLCGLAIAAAASARATQPEPISLWGGSQDVPRAAELPVLEGVAFHTIKPYEFNRDGYRFLHGVALAWHKEKLYASFGHNRGGENTDTEEARFCVSEDGGATWSDVRTIDAGEEPDIGVSHGVFLSHQGELWAFHGAYSGTMQNVHTRAYTLDGSTGCWQSRGRVVGNGFWPMTEPAKMEDGNWIMPGICVGEGNPAAVAISHGGDWTEWDLVVIPRGGGLGAMWGESSVLVDGARVVNISRYGEEPRALAALSRDYGRTWTPMVSSDLPMATSKPCAGTLSTGQRYLVGTTTADTGKRRAPLTIAVSKPGEARFSKVFVIRRAEFPEGPGESHQNASLAYPYAIENGGRLYVGYSNNGGNVGRVGAGRELWNNNSAELAIIPVKALRIDKAQ
ncbi:MAG: exo-alpha-sialidase [Pirellulales bacterium]|nr:exo-alpha-sialidase [Pirellulales bacterium]